MALFFSLVIGIVGLPIPDEFLMTYTGFLTSQHVLSYPITVLVGIAGSVSGISMSYWIGRYLGLPVLYKAGSFIGFTESHLALVEIWYQKYGRWVLVIGYFVPGVRHFTAFSAGMSRMPIITFMKFAYSGAILWVLTFVTAGRLLGEHWQQVIRFVHRYGIRLLLVGILVVAIIWLYRYLNQKST